MAKLKTLKPSPKLCVFINKKTECEKYMFRGNTCINIYNLHLMDYLKDFVELRYVMAKDIISEHND